jgi:hypothetical protein
MILEYMDEANQAISSQIGHSSNMAGLSTGKMEREIACILETKFHTEPTIDPGLEVRINPIMKDLIINMPAVKKESRANDRRQKTWPKQLKALGRINQPGWSV